MIEPIGINRAECKQSSRLLSWRGGYDGRFVPFYYGQSAEPYEKLLPIAQYLDLRISTLEDVFVLVGPGRDGVLFDHEGRVVSETLAYTDFAIEPYDLRHLQKNARSIDEPVFLAFDAAWRNYYHWTIIGLGRAMMYKALCEKRNRILLYDRTEREAGGWSLGFTKDVWRESLRHSRVVEDALFLKAGIYKIKSLDYLWLSDYRDLSVDQPPYISIFPQLYDQFRKAAGDRALANTRRRSAPKNLIIYRTDDDRLSALAADVLARLADHPAFTRVRLETLRFEDQLDLFGAANLVVAPHGAGLANLVYAPRTTKVLELNQSLKDEPHLRPWFYAIARGMNQSYSYLDNDRYAGSATDLQDRVIELAFS